jgi:hypothetical protein
MESSEFGQVANRLVELVQLKTGDDAWSTPEDDADSDTVLRLAEGFSDGSTAGPLAIGLEVNARAATGAASHDAKSWHRRLKVGEVAGP